MQNIAVPVLFWRAKGSANRSYLKDWNMFLKFCRSTVLSLMCLVYFIAASAANDSVFQVSAFLNDICRIRLLLNSPIHYRANRVCCCSWYLRTLFLWLRRYRRLWIWYCSRIVQIIMTSCHCWILLIFCRLFLIGIKIRIR